MVGVWRASVTHSYRETIVQRMAKMWLRDTRVTDLESLGELINTTRRFEEDMFQSATDYEDYQTKISLKMSSLETRADGNPLQGLHTIPSAPQMGIIELGNPAGMPNRHWDTSLGNESSSESQVQEQRLRAEPPQIDGRDWMPSPVAATEVSDQVANAAATSVRRVYQVMREQVQRVRQQLESEQRQHQLQHQLQHQQQEGGQQQPLPDIIQQEPLSSLSELQLYEEQQWLAERVPDRALLQSIVLEEQRILDATETLRQQRRRSYPRDNVTRAMGLAVRLADERRSRRRAREQRLEQIERYLRDLSVEADWNSGGQPRQRN